MNELRKFVDAQDGVFATAMEEIRGESKESHWMWFIFPQIRATGFVATKCDMRS